MTTCQIVTALFCVCGIDLWPSDDYWPLVEKLDFQSTLLRWWPGWLGRMGRWFAVRARLHTASKFHNQRSCKPYTRTCGFFLLSSNDIWEICCSPLCEIVCVGYLGAGGALPSVISSRACITRKTFSCVSGSCSGGFDGIQFSASSSFETTRVREGIWVFLFDDVLLSRMSLLFGIVSIRSAFQAAKSYQACPLRVFVNSETLLR